jgi:TolB-like protein
MSSLFQELKRRNVFRVAIAYVAVAWLILQVADIVFDNISAPAWLMQALMFFLAIGFPLAVLFAWAYEMTPEGIKKEKDVDRSESITAQTGQKLNRTIIVVLLAAVGFLLVDKFMLRDTVPDATATDSSVAVLPFVAMSSGPDDEYFADGLTEEILNSLARIPQILVTARTSSFHFKGQDIPIPDIAEKLGVANVVEGSIRRDGNRLRVTAQLIRAADGFHLWSKNYDRETLDTLGVQSDIAEQIAATLGVVLDDEQVARMQAVGVRNPEAFVAMQKGIEGFYAAHGKPNQNELLKENNAWFEKTLALEPGVSDAYAFHADYYTHVLLTELDRTDPDNDELRTAYDRLVADLDNAVRHAKNDSERAASRFELSILTGNWRGLPELFDEAVRDNKCRASGWIDAIGLAYGKADAFAQMSERLTKCDPLSYSGWRWLTTAQIWAGDAEEAIETAQRGQTYARHIRIQQQLVLGLIATGRIDDAEQVIARDVRDEFHKVRLQLAIESARGDLERSREIIGRLSQMENDVNHLALVEYARIGDRDAANQHAAKLDAMPLGFIRLMLMPAGCYCGAPWDLESTPNFARLLEDAELAWPPASPINWPLKDW